MPLSMRNFDTTYMAGIQIFINDEVHQKHNAIRSPQILQEYIFSKINITFFFMKELFCLGSFVCNLFLYFLKIRFSPSQLLYFF